MAHHYEGDDLIIRKVRVGSMENNTYVLECPTTHEALLVDGSAEPARILKGCEGASILGIVQTHGHHDHVEALEALVKSLDVPVYANPAEEYPVRIDVQLADGDTISFGDGREVTVLHTPGHTPGGVCLLIGEHLVSGDTLFPGGPGNTWNNPDLFNQIIEQIETKLFTLPNETRVYPGHGDDTTIGAEKPHLEEWKARGW